jgi:energy-coupling factor transporter ATP-binding protein EcfA2
MSGVTNEYLPQPGEFDPLAEEATVAGEIDQTSVGVTGDSSVAVIQPATKASLRMVQFYSPSELKAYEPPANQCLVGDYHLQRGAMSVLAGPPGCGKSRAALWLAILAARGSGNWFGLEVRSQFRTLILQNENGLTRLHRDFDELQNIEELDQWIKISSPPAYGLALSNPLFRAELKSVIKDFQPHLVIVDPWNSCVRDAMEKDFQEGIARLREVLAESPTEPACLILHHLRKPKSDDRHKGRNLAHLLSGSYVLVSVARSVLVMQPASDDTEDNRVVVTCAKNNDGDLGARSAWRRCAGRFEEAGVFDWEAFDTGSSANREPKVKEEHIRQVFGNGLAPMKMSEAAAALMEIAEVGRSAAYKALETGDSSRFAHLLCRQPNTAMLSLRPSGERPAKAPKPSIHLNP